MSEIVVSYRYDITKNVITFLDITNGRVIIKLCPSIYVRNNEQTSNFLSLRTLVPLYQNNSKRPGHAAGVMGQTGGHVIKDVREEGKSGL